MKKKQCAWCDKPIGLLQGREIAFGSHACSGACEILLSDALDGTPWDDLKKFEITLTTMSTEQYLKECKQRNIKP